MKRRLDTLKAIGRLQALMHDAGRWRLHSLDRQQAELTEDLKTVFEALGGEMVADGAHGNLLARRVRALQIRFDRLTREQESARSAVLRQGTRAKLAELAVESATLDVRRSDERRELVEIIERALARSASST
jgi:endonuclease/exonuclease/phosphatase family metal-dependent hydrolase